MTQKETGAADVTLDLLAIQSKAVEAIRDYSRYLRNAENAGLPDWSLAPRGRRVGAEAREGHVRLAGPAARGAPGAYSPVTTVATGMTWARYLPAPDPRLGRVPWIMGRGRVARC